MTSLERVVRAIEFRKPDKLPVCFEILDDNQFADKYGSDIVFGGFEQHKKSLPGNAWIDEWGCEWHSISSTVGEVRRPVLESLDDLPKLHVPDFGNDERYGSAKEIVAEQPDKFVLGSLGFLLFENMHHIIGLKQLMEAFYLERESVEELLNILVKHNLSIVDAYAKTGVHGLIAFEDWGLQDRLMISPKLWRELYKPAYKTIIERIHAGGMKFIMHSCGYILDIIDDFIEIGVDVLQLDQQFNMGLDALAEKCKGKVCMFCPYDIQATPQTEDMSELTSGVKRLVAAFYQDGGFIGKLYPQPKDVEITDEMMHTICTALTEN